MSKCVITYKNIEYPYEQFAAMMHDGLLRELVEQNVIDDSKFVGTAPKAVDISRITKLIQDNFKAKVIEDKTMTRIAGKLGKDGNIYINPNYAGFDTPIHEAGHILIDVIGRDNAVIKKAFEQLRGTDLYKETKKRYPELSDEDLDEEVLAEAIGREGEGIFEKESDKSKFAKYLDYIFDWLKNKLGMNKNVAKSLAKQVLSGIGTKKMEAKPTTEKLQKENTYKAPKALSRAQFMADKGINMERYQERIDKAEAAVSDAKDMKDEATLTEDRELLDKAEKALKKAKSDRVKAYKVENEFRQYKKDFKEVSAIVEAKDLESYTPQELSDLLHKFKEMNEKAVKTVKEDAMLRMAMVLREEGKEPHLKRDDYFESVADTKDINGIEKMMKHRNHFTEYQPEMQRLSTIIGNAFMDKIAESNAKKDTHEKLAVKVVKEINNGLGIFGKAEGRMSSESAKYFDWMDNGDGKLITVDQAKERGYSQAKINYLSFTRETLAENKDQLTKDNFENAVMEAVKVDKHFREAYKTEGLLNAFSYYLGGGLHNLGKVRIMYKGEPKAFSEIERDIIANTDRKSPTSMIKALFDLLVYNVQARRQLKRGFNVDERENPLEIKGESEYSLNENGALVSKFDKKRDENRSYSKDFYRAMNEFIDDTQHVKHMNPIMPLVESVEFLNKNGYLEQGIKAKPNTAEWIKEWKALHIYKEPKTTDPVLDASIKFFRKLVASTTMWFNFTANLANVLQGNYSSLRQEDLKTLIKGNKRLFSRKGVDKYSIALIKKYNIVNQDYDTNPTLRASNIFSKLATIGTQLGEYQIQGSLALGLMNDTDFNSHEFTKDKYGNEVLTVKKELTEEQEKALRERIDAIKSRVTDIQGKYPDEDRRNIMRSEMWKAIFQFKVWMPDWYKERFGAKYYNAKGELKEGTFNQLLRIGLKDFKRDLLKGDFKAIWNNKSFMSNMKGLMVIGGLLALKYQDDDDDEKSFAAKQVDNMIQQVLFIFDPNQAKYLVTNPVAALGKVKDLINAVESVAKFEDDADDKVLRVTPGGKLIKAVIK